MTLVKELVLTKSCVCLGLFKYREPKTGAIITHDSSRNIYADDYKPIMSEDGASHLVPENYDEDMSTPVKISELSTTDAAALADLTRKKITVSTTGSTVTNDFFENDITAIGTEGQYYEVGVHFTQSGTTITGINGVSFSENQIIIAYL